MAEPQPPSVVEGATTGDVEDEVPASAAKSAEDRKAAAALAKLDERGDDAAGAAVDAEAVSKAMANIGKPAAAKAAPEAPAKKVKVDPADVAELVRVMPPQHNTSRW
jgi:hypothetical protein